MTAIADIIVKPSTESNSRELQLSQNLNTQSSSKISFSDLLNQQKAVDSAENSKAENPTDSNAENVKDVKKSETEKTVEKSKKEENSTKTTEEKSEEKTEKTDSKETTEKNQVGKNVENNSEIKENDKKSSKKISDSKDSKKSTEKASAKKDEDKKLDNEYNRLNEIVDSSKNGSEENAELQVALTEKNGEQTKNQLEINDENLLKNDLEITESEKITGKKTDAADFNFENNKTGKISKLDKDGKIIVNDLRSEKTESKASEKNQIKTSATVEFTDDKTATITMDLASQNADNNILSLNNQTAASEGSNFQAMLNNQIQQNAPEFVKAGSLILKDNDQGTINLVLHPDDIGNVKIHLSLDGKTVSAQITVNTKEAMEVFKDNAQTLREAFAQNGFETSNFDVSYNNQGGQNSQNFENDFNGTEYIAKHAYDSFAVSGSEGYIQENYENISEYSINIVA